MFPLHYIAIGLDRFISYLAINYHNIMVSSIKKNQSFDYKCTPEERAVTRCCYQQTAAEQQRLGLAEVELLMAEPVVL